MMDTNSYMGMARTLAPMIVAWLVARGYIPTYLATDGTVALVALAAAVWSMHSNHWKLEFNTYMGIVRATVPALVAWIVGKGYLPPGITATDLDAFLIGAGGAFWSVHSNSAVVAPTGSTATPAAQGAQPTSSSVAGASANSQSAPSFEIPLAELQPNAAQS